RRVCDQLRTEMGRQRGLSACRRFDFGPDLSRRSRVAGRRAGLRSQHGGDAAAGCAASPERVSLTAAQSERGMTKRSNRIALGYKLSSEEQAPRDLVRYAQMAEDTLSLVRPRQ